MPDPSPEQVRQIVHDVLARPEYAWWHEASSRRGVAASLARLLGDLLQWLAELRATDPVVYWLLVAALGVTALALLAHSAWTVRAALRATAPATRGPAPGGAPDFLGLADGLARGGDFLEAARHVQLAVIDLLVRRGVITLERCEPNLVLRHRLRGAALPAQTTAACVALLDRLERACFRDHSASPELYRDWRALHDRLREGAAA